MPRGRPLGEVSRIVLAALAEQPRTVHQLARDLQAHERMVVVAATRLRAAGKIEAIGISRASRSGRPVAVLAPTPERPTEDRSNWPIWLR